MQQEHCVWGSPQSHKPLQRTQQTGNTVARRGTLLEASPCTARQDLATDTWCSAHTHPRTPIRHPCVRTHHTASDPKSKKASRQKTQALAQSHPSLNPLVIRARGEAFHPMLNTRWLGTSRDFLKGLPRWCAKGTPGSWEGGRPGRRLWCEPTTQVLCSGVRFLMKYTRVLSHVVFNRQIWRCLSYFISWSLSTHPHDWHSSIIIKRWTTSYGKAFMHLFRLCELKNLKNLPTVKFYCMERNKRRKNKKYFTFKSQTEFVVFTFWKIKHRFLHSSFNFILYATSQSHFLE